jgi:hypothetical protein
LIQEQKMAGQASDNEDRVLRARIAALVLHAQISDEAAHTAPARAAFLSRFEREVDPDGLLDPVERARRAEHAKKAYFLKLALASRKARSAKKRANTDRKPDAGNDEGDES